MTKVKSLIRFLVAMAIIVEMITICNCQAAKKQSGQQAEPQFKYQPKQLNINERLKNQQQRLQNIKEVSSKERRSIEDWYEYRFNKLQRRTEEYIRTFKMPNRVLWTEFIKAYNQIPYADSYTTPGDYFKLDTYLLDPAPTFLMNIEARKLLGKMLYIYSSGKTPDFLVDEKTPYPVKYKMTELFSVKEIRKIRRLFTAMREFESKSIRLQNRRKAKLVELERWQKNTEEDVFRVIREIKAQPETPVYGTVNAISYGPNQAFVMIGGIDEELIPQGSRVNSIKIVKIHRDRVEFEKSGKSWVQVIGAPANPAWAESF
jgi:hypothetical protein